MDYSVDEAISLLSVVEPHYPLWINVSIGENINLGFSMRFRKPSELLNREYGFSPFKII